VSEDMKYIEDLPSDYYKKYILGECPVCGMPPADHKKGNASCVNFPTGLHRWSRKDGKDGKEQEAARMDKLDDFLGPLARRINERKPQPFVVAESIIWDYYKPHLQPLDPRPYAKMKEVAAAIGCNCAVAVWAYKYVFWWGEWEDHPYVELRDKDVCGLMMTNGFTCYGLKGSHKCALE